VELRKQSLVTNANVMAAIQAAQRQILGPAAA
jgi:hypothetical protein